MCIHIIRIKRERDAEEEKKPECAQQISLFKDKKSKAHIYKYKERTSRLSDTNEKKKYIYINK
jgi:hypothetical protein